mmetsp:Transcript_30025/g.76465  ORF Transcript_30025/g.76465 Transcript_30025/m.76465 type:complete len:201 (-) Transcript_30025:1258-1860(-)
MHSRPHTTPHLARLRSHASHCAPKGHTHPRVHHQTTPHASQPNRSRPCINPHVMRCLCAAFARVMPDRSVAGGRGHHRQRRGAGRRSKGRGQAAADGDVLVTRLHLPRVRRQPRAARGGRAAAVAIAATDNTAHACRRHAACGASGAAAPVVGRRGVGGRGLVHGGGRAASTRCSRCSPCCITRLGRVGEEGGEEGAAKA